MSPALGPNSATLSPAETVIDMIGNILDEPKMDIREKLAALRELCVQHISFGLPGQAIKIISSLAAIVASDPSPEVRVAALQAMERMIGLEEKAEAEGKPAIDWRAVNVLLRNAKQQTELDTLPVASRFDAPSPEAAGSLPPELAFEDSDDESPETHASSRGDEVTPEEEAALLAVQESAVAAIKAAPASGRVPVVEKPELSRKTVPVIEDKSEPPIMKFLRSVADTDNEERIRALANRVITKIENLTARTSPSPPAPAITEG